MAFSLKMLLVAFAYAALFCAALMPAPQFWARLFIAASYFLVLSAGLTAMFGPRALRPMWVGFTIVAGVFLVMTVYPGNFAQTPANDVADWINAQLQGMRARHWSAAEEHGLLPDWAIDRSSNRRGVKFPVAGYVVSEPVNNLIWNGVRHTQIVANCLAAVLVGLLGGALAQRAARQRNRQESTT